MRFNKSLPPYVCSSFILQIRPQVMYDEGISLQTALSLFKLCNEKQQIYILVFFISKYKYKRL